MSKAAARDTADMIQTTILVVIGIVAVSGIFGVILAHDHAVQIIGFCSLICVSLLGLLQQQRVAVKAEEVADKVEQVQTVLQMTDAETRIKLNSLVKVADDTHTLVNNNMAIQLRLNAELSKWKADQTKKVEDIEAATMAEKLYTEHEGKQRVVDARKEEKT